SLYSLSSPSVFLWLLSHWIDNRPDQRNTRSLLQTYNYHLHYHPWMVNLSHYRFDPTLPYAFPVLHIWMQLFPTQSLLPHSLPHLFPRPRSLRILPLPAIPSPCTPPTIPPFHRHPLHHPYCHPHLRWPDPLSHLLTTCHGGPLTLPASPLHRG